MSRGVAVAQTSPRSTYSSSSNSHCSPNRMAFPRSPEEIFTDYQNRRGGLLRALTDGTLGFHPNSVPRLLSANAAPHGPLDPHKGHVPGQEARRSPPGCGRVAIPCCVRCLPWPAELDALYQAADPERENLCLYGAVRAARAKPAAQRSRPCHTLSRDPGVPLQARVTVAGRWSCQPRKSLPSSPSPAWASTSHGME